MAASLQSERGVPDVSIEPQAKPEDHQASPEAPQAYSEAEAAELSEDNLSETKTTRFRAP